MALFTAHHPCLCIIVTLDKILAFQAWWRKEITTHLVWFVVIPNHPGGTIPNYACSDIIPNPCHTTIVVNSEQAVTGKQTFRGNKQTNSGYRHGRDPNPCLVSRQLFWALDQPPWCVPITGQIGPR